MLKYIKGQSGFSLVEVIVAMVLIATIGAAFVSIYYTATRASISSQERLDAIIEAENQIEYLRSNHITLISSITPNSSNVSVSILMSNQYGDGETTITLESYDEGRGFALYKIIVRVNSEHAQPVYLGGKLVVEYP